MRHLLVFLVLLIGLPVFAGPSHPVHKINPPIDGEFPGGRGTDELVVYTPFAGRTHTGTNRWGVEATVVRGVVIKAVDNNSAIPSDGFVVSGHGEAAHWISGTLRPGTVVYFTEDTLYVDERPPALAQALLFRLERLRENPHFPSGMPRVQEEMDSLRGKLETMLAEDEYAELAEVRGTIDGFENQAWRQRLMAMPSPEGEVRGVWSRLPVYTEEAIIAYVEGLEEAGINVYFPEVIYGSQSLYHDPTGLYPKFKEFGELDPLEIIIRECHARGIEVHAWVHCFFIGIQANEEEPALLAQRFPDWLAQNRKGSQVSEVEPRFMYFSPSHPEVRKAMIDAYVALAENYAIDGFQFDYIRYSHPDSWKDQWDYSDIARANAKEALGFDPMDITPDDNPEEWARWMQWREDVITSFVRETAEAVRAVRPNLILTADVFPDLEEAIVYKGQNWAKWAQEGYIDALIPMAYSRSSEDVANAIKEMESVSPEGYPLVIGLGPFLGLTDEELITQIEAVREAGSTGQVLFSWETTSSSSREALGIGPWKNKTEPVFRP